MAERFSSQAAAPVPVGAEIREVGIQPTGRAAIAELDAASLETREGHVHPRLSSKRPTIRGGEMLVRRRRDGYSYSDPPLPFQCMFFVL